MSSEHILVVEDDPVVLHVLESQLLAAGYEVTNAVKATEAIDAVRARKPDLMILDLGLVDEGPGNSLNDGFAFLHYLRWTLPGTDFPVIVHTADTSRTLETRAKASGVCAVFRKGADLGELLLAVRKALDGQRARQAA